MICKFLYILLLLIVLADYSYSQNEIIPGKSYETDEIVVEGFKIPADIFISPTKIKIFNKKELENVNGNRLSDVLDLAGNVYIRSYGGNSTLKTISLNGSAAEETLILIDGNRLNSFQNSQVDLSQISTDNIDRIEIINNGMSSIYGSDAMSGVVNIITNNNSTKHNTGISLSNELGSYNYQKYNLNIIQKINKLSISAYINYEKSKDDYDYNYFDGTVDVLKKRENSDYSYKNFNLSFFYKPDNNSSLKFYSDYSDNLRNIPGIETGTPSSLSVQKDNLWNTYLNYEHLIGNTLNFKTNFNYQDNLIHYENLPFIKSFYKNVTLSNNSQFIFKKASETILGYDLTYGVLNSNEVENNPERLQLGIYTVSNLKLLSNKTLLLFPSLRYDYFSDSKISNLSARLGLNYNVLGKGFIYLKSNIGNNFRAPTFNELYWNPGGNKNLLQEKSFSIDLGFIMNYNFIFSNIFEFNYIYNNITNKIVWIPNPTGFWSPDNIGNTEIKNLNFELKLFKQLTTRIKFSTDITLNFCKSLNDVQLINNNFSEKQQIYVPGTSMKINSGIELFGFNLNFSYQYYSKRYIDLDNINYLPSTELLDGNIGYNLSINGITLNLRFEVNNVFNENYQWISGYPMPLRNYNFGIQLKY